MSEENEVEEDEKIGINIWLLGNEAVGKSSFISRFVNNKFTSDYIPTIGLNTQLPTKIIDIGEKEYKIIFFDTTGNKQYIPNLSKYIQKTHGFIIMYDITNKESFEAIPNWIKTATDIKGKNVPMIILGNKEDQKFDRKIKEEDGEKFFISDNIDFLEISNKSGYNIDNAITKLVNKIVNNMSKEIDDLSNSNSEKTGKYLVDNQKNKEKKSCCS